MRTEMAVELLLSYSQMTKELRRRANLFLRSIQHIIDVCDLSLQDVEVTDKTVRIYVRDAFSGLAMPTLEISHELFVKDPTVWVRKHVVYTADGYGLK